MWKNIILFISAALIFSSCEDNMFLKSEKKMKADLQGTWQREFLGDTAVHRSEQWIFTEDNLYTVYTIDDPPDFYDDGAPDTTLYDNRDTNIISKFKIDAKTFKAYLKFQLVHGDTTHFVDKWEFVTLKDGVLYLAADDPAGNAVLQLEFAKVK
jgi:hypothetical protein